MLRLAAQPQALDQRPVSIGFRSPHVLEESPPPAHEFEQTPAGMMVLAVQLEMLGETIDALRQKRHLNIRRTRVGHVDSEGLHGLFLDCAGDQFRPRRRTDPLIPITPCTSSISPR